MNKRIVLWIALIAMAIIPVYAQQYDPESDFQIDWDEDVEGAVMITKYIGSKKEVSIPPKIQNSPVVSVFGFSGNKNVTKVTIPNGVIWIGSFNGCTSLTSVTIPDSVKSINRMTFADCTSLTSITIPDSVTAIGGGAFNGCTKLTSITLPNGIKSIATYNYRDSRSSQLNRNYGAFTGCTSLKNITIPDSVTSVRTPLLTSTLWYSLLL